MTITKRCFWLGIVLLFVVVITSCKHEVMQKDTIQRNGVLFEIGKMKPFSGVVVGKGREGYRRMRCTFEKAYQNGLLHGLSVSWYENGKVESKEQYVEGELNGMVTRYWTNGKPKARIHFTNGMRGGGNGEMYWDVEGRAIRD